jgi:hypothetical protein
MIARKHHTTELNTMAAWDMRLTMALICYGYSGWQVPSMIGSNEAKLCYDRTVL